MCIRDSARDAPNPDIKIPKHLKEPKEKDEDLKTQKATGTNQGKNSNPKTQKLQEVIQWGEPSKPGRCLTRRRRESQLITAAPLESATLRWTPPRERAGYVNLKAPRTTYGPSRGRVARREKRELERPRICLLYTSPSPRDATLSRMPSSA